MAKEKKYKRRNIAYVVKSENGNTIADLIQVSAPCTVTYTVNSVTVDSKRHGKLLYSRDGSRLTFPEMRYIQSFRQHFKKHGKTLNYTKDYLRKHAKFMQFNVIKPGVYTDVVQIDINKAYPSAARLLKIIDEEMYQKGVSISKRASLISIGSLHRQRRVIKVDKNGKRKLVNDDLIKNGIEKRIPYMSNIWRSIVNFVDFTMRKIFVDIGHDAYFYWVDAIFCKKSRLNYVVKQLKNSGFETKVIPVTSIEYNETKVTAIHSDGEKKVYQLPKSKPFYVDNIDQPKFR